MNEKQQDILESIYSISELNEFRNKFLYFEGYENGLCIIYPIKFAMLFGNVIFNGFMMSVDYSDDDKHITTLKRVYEQKVSELPGFISGDGCDYLPDGNNIINENLSANIEYIKSFLSDARDTRHDTREITPADVVEYATANIITDIDSFSDIFGNHKEFSGEL